VNCPPANLGVDLEVCQHFPVLKPSHSTCRACSFRGRRQLKPTEWKAYHWKRVDIEVWLHWASVSAVSAVQSDSVNVYFIPLRVFGLST